MAGSGGPMPRLTHRQILTVLAGLMLGMLVAALSQTIVATALPTIVGELGGQEKLVWVVSGALLASTIAIPIWGKLSDLYGRKVMFQLAIAVFVVASLAAGFSQNIGQLIAFRGVQGIGIGGLMALSQAIMGDVVSPRQRGRYQGYLGSVFGVATVAGPLIGGFLVEHLSWRATFFVGVPIGVAALIVTEHVLRLPFPRRKAKIDWLGAFFIVVSVGAILLVLSLGGKEFPWHSITTYLLTVVGLLFLALAIWQERRCPEPIMPPWLFTNPTFVLANCGLFIVGAAMFAAIIYLPQYLQIIKAEAPMASGLLMVPLMAGLLISSIGSGRLIVRTGRYKRFPVIGLLLVALGMALLSRLGANSSLVSVEVFMLITGFGIGFVIQILVLAIQNTVPRGDLGAATSGATFFRAMGGAIGVAVFGAVLSHQVRQTMPAKLAEAGVNSDVSPSQLLGSPAEIAALPEPVHHAVISGYADGLQAVFLWAVPLVLAGWVLVLFLKETPLRHTDEVA